VLLSVGHGTITAKGTVPKLKTTRRGASQAKTAKRSSPAKSKVASRGGPSKKAAKRPAPEEEAAFTDALIQSGEAACLDSEGKLPAGATHKIVEDEAGQKKVVRRRFSMT
jgi:hypothetical protein